ncbi:hypothetical protein [Bartonella sp. DGB1]|uniref:hypothetical protein n=1 Tax=Bartonella sp. DGB1 TaxID=3239807 RepID=UPI003523C855
MTILFLNRNYEKNRKFKSSRAARVKLNPEIYHKAKAHKNPDKAFLGFCKNKVEKKKNRNTKTQL